MAASIRLKVERSVTGQELRRSSLHERYGAASSPSAVEETVSYLGNFSKFVGSATDLVSTTTITNLKFHFRQRLLENETNEQKQTAFGKASRRWTIARASAGVNNFDAGVRPLHFRVVAQKLARTMADTGGIIRRQRGSTLAERVARGIGVCRQRKPHRCEANVIPYCRSFAPRAST